MPARRHSLSGQASVEFVAIVPALLVCVLIAAQLALAGHALWSAGVAARAGARADHIGGDAVAAAKRALPGVLKDGARVRTGPPVRVSVPVPPLIPGLPRFDVDAATSLEPDAGS